MRTNINKNKKKRILFREYYNKLKSQKEKYKYVKSLGQEFNEILEGLYLFQDKRDGKLYDCMIVEETRWLSQNFALPITGLKKDGKYTWDGYINACPEGWRLPNSGDYCSLLGIARKMAGFTDVDDDLYSRSYDVKKILEENQDLDFNAGLAVYGYNDSYLPFWLEDKSKIFYIHDGQNECSYGIEPICGTKEAYARYVQNL